MNNCIFCKIVAGEIPNYTVYEDNDFLAFLDVRPLNPGHTLIVPKKHYRWVWDVPNIGRYMEIVQKIAKAQQKVFKTDFVISQIIGEEVSHAHIWLVPRTKNDGHDSILDIENVKDISKEEMQKIAEKLATTIN